MSDPTPLTDAIAEGLHKAMCFSTTMMHNRLACPRQAVYLNLATAALSHPAVTETLAAERRSAEAAFGALSAVSDELSPGLDLRAALLRIIDLTMADGISARLDIREVARAALDRSTP